MLRGVGISRPGIPWARHQRSISIPAAVVAKVTTSRSFGSPTAQGLITLSALARVSTMLYMLVTPPTASFSVSP